MVFQYIAYNKKGEIVKGMLLALDEKAVTEQDMIKGEGISKPMVKNKLFLPMIPRVQITGTIYDSNPRCPLCEGSGEIQS